ncbi:D-serine deaminase-like pyridoxal phosphate-dependent protein [Catenuloplanes nepalensis]|uniref:D-serine deaminase-like pyridoxal phosphate-dependent protein n=2 Tax=Catenuloplanes nepalensis TaxID=587533 RepID=A0ABT9MUI1_9ACTN|nr:D-serine deaminase-like pyridoxal phosphate-dependent protein [Catenuloplanes nepalensis]
MSGASQEHGTLALRPGSTGVLPDLPVGTRVRILPNHACATAAQHRQYRVIDGDTATGAPVIETSWARHDGW